jgi:hypothetical protein
MTAVVRDARPPTAMVRVLNPIMRVLLRTPLGRMIGPLALIEFAGRHSGQRYRVPLGWHEADGVAVVFTPAPWRTNFSPGALATVHHRGRAQQMIGTLITDPDEVAHALRSVLTNGTSPHLVGLNIPAGHSVTAADAAAVGRAMIQFRPQAAPIR